VAHPVPGLAARRLPEPGQPGRGGGAPEPRRDRSGHRRGHRGAGGEGRGGEGSEGGRGDHQEDAVTGHAVAPARARPRGTAAERWVDRNLRWLLPGPAVVTLLLLMVFPLVYTAYLSLHEWYASSVLGPQFVGLQNYVQLFARDERFWPAFVTTLVFTVGSVILTVVLGLGIAHLLIRVFPGRGLARTLMLLPMIATPVAMALVWMTMMSPTIGVLNWLLACVGLPPSAWVSSPRSVIAALLLVETWMWTPMTT